MALPLLQVLQKSHPMPLSLCQINDREYYEWFCRLKRHIRVGRLPFQGTWLGLAAQSAIWESMRPGVVTSNNSVLNARRWRCPLPNSTSLALPHPNSWLETHLVLGWSHLICIFQLILSLSHWFLFIETSRHII